MESKRIKKVSNKLQEFIKTIANIGESTIRDDDGMIYYSKVDGSYLTRVGLEKDLSFLLKFGITEQIQNRRCIPDSINTSNIGFNPIEQKWYGWSHRAIFGFGVGSECKLGNCGFKPSNIDEFTQSVINFWGDNEYSSGDERTEIGFDGVYFRYTYNDKVPNKLLRGTESVNFTPFPEKWGNGTWEAKTLDDAKQMAIDFAEGVS